MTNFKHTMLQPGVPAGCDRPPRVPSEASALVRPA
jgi:hypothetical protein